MIENEIKKNRFVFLNILDFWSINAVMIALLVVAPLLSVFVIALNPTENIWPHLVSTTLPRYASNTIILMCFVGFLAAVLGTCLLYTSPSPRDVEESRMPSSA